MTETNATRRQISRVVVRGYRSIAECDLSLRSLNVLIGANGAGKSNFIGFFRFLRQVIDKRLQVATSAAGGPDALLHFGRKTTEELACDVYIGDVPYGFVLSPTTDNRFMFTWETIGNFEGMQARSSGYFESEANLYESWDGPNRLDATRSAMEGWRIYHFHDTGESSRIKQVQGINDNEYLREDARNLAAFLLRLKNHHVEHYRRIVKTIQLVAPFFGDFHLRPTVDNKERIQLEWTENGQDEPFTASQLSDGTLRFVCLATVLLQPKEFMPTTIFIDEPELGLHPFSIGVLAGLMKSASVEHQLLVSTQSAELVDELDVEDLVVVDKRDAASVFRRPNATELAQWMDDYSLGDMWKKNLLGGRPGR